MQETEQNNGLPKPNWLWKRGSDRFSGLDIFQWFHCLTTTTTINKTRTGEVRICVDCNLIRLHKRSSARGFSACYAAKIQTRSPNSWLSHWKIHWSCIDFLNIISPGVITRRPWTSEGNPRSRLLVQLYLVLEVEMGRWHRSQGTHTFPTWGFSTFLDFFW